MVQGRKVVVGKETNGCSVVHCHRPYYAKGMCKRHYTQVLKHGQLLDIKRSRTDGNEILLKEEHAEIILYDKTGVEAARSRIDLQKVSQIKDIKWRISSNGYVKGSIGREDIYLHRFLTGINTVVDHINGDRMDNRVENLRPATIQKNTFNSKKRCTNTSGFKGVTICKKTGAWISQIMHDGKHIHLGRFQSSKEAALAYNEAAVMYFGDYALLNQVDAINAREGR